MTNKTETQMEIHLTEVQQGIMKAIETKSLEDFYKVLAENPKEDVNFIDNEKITPLQQAAYRGNIEMVRLLLKRGADVNKCEHAQDYTTLHFGALSGNIDVCHLLLAAGVKTNALNSINRTPAQLAAFVGHYSIVSTINNFIPKSDIDYYSKIQGSQTKPYLDPEITDNVYKFVLMYNMHPVKIALLLNTYSLSDHIDSICKVLELMSQKEMKSKSTNEVLGFKYHYMCFILGEIKKTIMEMNGKKGYDAGVCPKLSNMAEKEIKGDKQEKTFVDLFARMFLKINRAGDQEAMDLMIRQAVKSFPHIESTLFRQMVASLTTDENSPTALSIVSAAVNGQRAFADESGSCGSCGEEKAMKKCAKCKWVSYCDKECQRLHWFVHKKMCGKFEERSRKPNVQVDPRELNNDLAGILAGAQ